MIIAFWASLFIVFYTFLGYGIVLWLLVRLKTSKPFAASYRSEDLPSCSLLIAAYNEENFIRAKIENTLRLDYPAGKLKIIFVTDGSDDRTPDILREYPGITVLHQPERRGKVAAIHRAVNTVDTDIIIFTDANTLLNKKALEHIARHYSNPTVGAVAGEKRIKLDETADAGAAGEGFYWKYESTLKRWDSRLYSVVGAAGELFSVRTSLYEPVSESTILDDFMISMLIAKKGYRIVYEPEAYAVETASESVSEELKRKIRIAAGGIQSVVWLAPLLNIFRYGLLSFQYVSHRVLRWTITPFLLILLAVLNIWLVIDNKNIIYQFLLAGQAAFYTLALAGFAFERYQIGMKAFFVPYYFCVMNYAVIAGLFRYLNNSQSAAWEKARRRTEDMADIG